MLLATYWDSAVFTYLMKNLVQELCYKPAYVFDDERDVLNTFLLNHLEVSSCRW